MAAGIWVRLMRKNRIEGSLTQPCAYEGWQDALEEACHTLDIPRPLVLPKHLRDWDAFSQTRFLREHFLESVAFDRMEVEYIDPEVKKTINEKYL